MPEFRDSPIHIGPPQVNANAHVLTFFNAQHDRLLATHQGSATMSSASKGGLREREVREALQPILPPMVRIESGDIVDPFGGKTGQLDGILLDDRSPSLKSRPDSPAICLAEGVIAVVEVKSDLSGQWDEVESTFRKLSAIRVSGQLSNVPIPFVVIGYRGWKTAEPYLERVRSLLEISPDHSVDVASLEDMCVTSAQPGAAGKRFPLRASYPHVARGMVLASLWAWLSELGRSILYRPLPFVQYLTGEAPAAVVIQPPHVLVAKRPPF